jgi:Bax protein
MSKKILFSFACFIIAASLVSPTVQAEPPVQHQNFINYIMTQSIISNKEIMRQRKQILALYQIYQNHGKLSTNDKLWLKEIALEYKAPSDDFSQNSTWKEILLRVGIVPNSLVIAQAINESAWGTSRFAREGNNFFGQWCYSPGCGLIPLSRDAQASYEVKNFSSPLSGVKSYMLNLNSTRLYHGFREKRQALRAQNKPIDGLALSSTLRMYSTERDNYVQSISGIIDRYNLCQYDQPLTADH